MMIIQLRGHFWVNFWGMPERPLKFSQVRHRYPGTTEYFYALECALRHIHFFYYRGGPQNFWEIPPLNSPGYYALSLSINIIYYISILYIYIYIYIYVAGLGLFFHESALALAPRGLLPSAYDFLCLIYTKRSRASRKGPGRF
jgi:hypothetical protein